MSPYDTVTSDIKPENFGKTEDGHWVALDYHDWNTGRKIDFTTNGLKEAKERAKLFGNNDPVRLLFAAYKVKLPQQERVLRDSLLNIANSVVVNRTPADVTGFLNDISRLADTEEEGRLIRALYFEETRPLAVMLTGARTTLQFGYGNVTSIVKQLDDLRDSAEERLTELTNRQSDKQKQGYFDEDDAQSLGAVLESIAKERHMLTTANVFL